MSRRFVITGGAGFIDSNLAGARSRPEKRGSVAVIDDLSTGKSENLSGTDARPLIQGSITDLELLISAFEGADCVYHLAAIASVKKSTKDQLLRRDRRGRGRKGTPNVFVAAL